jgi:hypothetical protein
VKGLDVQLPSGVLLIRIVQQPWRDLGELAAGGGQVSIEVWWLTANGQPPARFAVGAESQWRDVVSAVLDLQTDEMTNRGMDRFDVLVVGGRRRRHVQRRPDRLVRPLLSERHQLLDGLLEDCGKRAQRCRLGHMAAELPSLDRLFVCAERPVSAAHESGQLAPSQTATATLIENELTERS